MPSPSRTRRLAHCAAAAAVVVTAGAILASGTPARGAARDVASTCPKGSPPGDRIGAIVFPKKKVFVNSGKGPNTRAKEGTKLYVGTAVCVAEGALVKFKLEAGGSTAECSVEDPMRLVLKRTQKNAIAIDVQPPGIGSSLDCKGTTIWVSSRSPKTKLRAAGTDPLFRVTFEANATRVRVESGFVKLEAPGDATATVVGPHQQATARPTEVTPATDAAPLPADQRLEVPKSAALQLRASLERPDCVPGRCTSPTLLRILRRGSIVFRIDAGASRRTRDFVESFARLLGLEWNLKAPIAGPGELRAADVLVAPAGSPRAQTLLFFADPTGRRWLFNASPDPVFVDALRTFLQATLDNGTYGTLYENAFGVRKPRYAPLAPFLFATPACLPGESTGTLVPPNLSLRTSLSPSGPIAAVTTVRQDVEATNQGEALDCAVIRVRVFGAGRLDRLAVRGLPAGKRSAPTPSCSETTAGGSSRTFRCRIASPARPLGAGATARVRVLARPSRRLRTGETVQSCAEVDAEGALPRDERHPENNGACVAILRRRPLLVGAAEDAVQQPALEDAKAKLDLMRLAGFHALVVTEQWEPGLTSPRPEAASRLANTVAAADLAGIRVFLAIYHAPGTTPVAEAARRQFAAFARAALQGAPSVVDVVIGNEPNSSSFWTPQFRGKADAAAAAYERLLALTYDAVKAVNPRIRVIGGALAPRGDDPDPKHGRAGHDHSPKTFIADLGAAYAKSGRRRPIMDAFAFHPMPETPAQRPDTPYPADSTALALANYDRLAGLLGRAFGETSAQRGSTLPILYTEYGVETEVPPAKAASYTGAETSESVDAATQANSYERAIALAACQPTVEALFVFHAFDEPALDRWQSGVYYADGSPKPSLGAVRRAAEAAAALQFASCLPRAS